MSLYKMGDIVTFNFDQDWTGPIVAIDTEKNIYLVDWKYQFGGRGEASWHSPLVFSLCHKVSDYEDVLI